MICIFAHLKSEINNPAPLLQSWLYISNKILPALFSVRTNVPNSFSNFLSPPDFPNTKRWFQFPRVRFHVQDNRVVVSPTHPCVAQFSHNHRHPHFWSKWKWQRNRVEEECGRFPIWWLSISNCKSQITNRQSLNWKLFFQYTCRDSNTKPSV